VILAVHSDEMPITEVDDIAENQIAQQISRIAGVSQVNIGGQQKPAVRVQVDPVKIAALGIQMEDIATVISQASVNSPNSHSVAAKCTARAMANRGVIAACLTVWRERSQRATSKL
jgi:multidrug efflux pump subunit AcrB